MKNRQIGAYLVSTLVLLVAGLFYTYSYVTLFGNGHDRYPITAQFYSANGLSTGGNVILAGVPIGTIRAIHLNKQTYMADVLLEVDNDIRIPKDSVLTVNSTSMTDDDAVFVLPGKSKEYFEAQNTITNTRESLSLEQQIGNYIFNTGKLN